MLFGSSPITVKELVHAITTKVEPLVRTNMGLDATSKPTQRQRDQSSEWTKALKIVLFKLGREHKCHVYCNGKGFTREFMLDVLWCCGESPREGIALACESEWQYADAVSEDFQKLMVVKAPLKLLTYSGKDPLGEQVRARVKEDMELYPYHVAGEEYVFIGLDFDTWKAHGYRVPSDGRQTNVILEDLVVRHD